jgi:hypothetical protein
MVNASLVVLLLTSFAATGSPAAAGPAPRRCGDAPSTVTRVWLTTMGSTSSRDVEAAKAIVDRTWQEAGITFDWLPSSPVPRLENTDVTILIEEPPLLNAPKDALGAVRFVQGQPQKIVRVSTGAIAAWLAARMIGSRKWGHEAGWFLSSPASSRMLDRALGHVIAHEIGHVLLADPRHSRWGLMQAAYANVRALEDDAPLMSIDDGVRERLRLRLAGVALCN